MTNPFVKTPQEWASLRGIIIIDPDGWRFPVKTGSFEYEAKPIDEPIGELEFKHRIRVSTLRLNDSTRDYLHGVI